MCLVVLLQQPDIIFTQREIFRKNSGIKSPLFVSLQAMWFIWRALKRKVQVLSKKMDGTFLPAQMNGLRLLTRRLDLMEQFGFWIGITSLCNTTLRLLPTEVATLQLREKEMRTRIPCETKPMDASGAWLVRMQRKIDSLSLNKNDPDDLIEALKSDNLFWRMTAQRLLVERGNLDVLPELYDLVKNNDIDDLGYNYAATHALWIIDGLGAFTKDDQAEKIITGALEHPSAGVRKAAIQILSKSRLSEEVVTKSKILQDPDPNTRLAAVVALTEVSPSGTLGEILYQMSQEESVNNDHWLGKAVYAAAGQHKQGFIDAFMKANPGYKSTPEEIKKREAADWNDVSWKQMKLPQNFEKAGLNIDGLVWFRKTIEIPRNAVGKKSILSLGPVDDSDITWINGNTGWKH